MKHCDEIWNVNRSGEMCDILILSLIIAALRKCQNKIFYMMLEKV